MDFEDLYRKYNRKYSLKLLPEFLTDTYKCFMKILEEKGENTMGSSNIEIEISPYIVKYNINWLYTKNYGISYSATFRISQGDTKILEANLTKNNFEKRIDIILGIPGVAKYSISYKNGKWMYYKIISENGRVAKEEISKDEIEKGLPKISLRGLYRKILEEMKVIKV